MSTRDDDIIREYLCRIHGPDGAAGLVEHLHELEDEGDFVARIHGSSVERTRDEGEAILDLESLRVRNIKCLQDCTLTIEPGLTVLSAPNESGKSSLIEGLCLALSRHAAAGSRETVLRHGADTWEVEARFGSGSIHRRYGRRVIETGKGAGNVAWDHTLRAQFRGDSHAPDRIDDGEKIIAGVGLLGIPVPVVLASALARQDEIARLLTAAAGERRELLLPLLDLNGIDETREHLRRAAKAQEVEAIRLRDRVAQAEAKLAALAAQPSDTTALGERIAQLEAQLRDTEGDPGLELRAQQTRTVAALRDARRLVETAENAAQRLAEARAGEAEEPTAEGIDALRGIEAAEADLRSSALNLAQLAAEKTRIGAAGIALDKTAKDPLPWHGCCKRQCTGEGWTADYVEQRAQLAEDFAAAKDLLSRATHAEATARARVEVLRELAGETRTLIATRDARARAIAQAEAAVVSTEELQDRRLRVRELEADLVGIEERIDRLQPASGGRGAIEREVAEARRKVARREALAGQIAAGKDEIAEHQTGLDLAEMRLKRTNALVSAYSKAGLGQWIVSRELSGIADDANRYLAPAGYRIQIDEDLSIFAGRDGVEPIDVALEAGSVRQIVGLGFRIGLSLWLRRVSGARVALLVVDEIPYLDADHAALAVTMLASLVGESGIDRVLLLDSSGQMVEAAAGRWRLLTLVGGQIRPLHATAGGSPIVEALASAPDIEAPPTTESADNMFTTESDPWSGPDEPAADTAVSEAGAPLLPLALTPWRDASLDASMADLACLEVYTGPRSRPRWREPKPGLSVAERAAMNDAYDLRTAVWKDARAWRQRRRNG